MTTPWCLDRFRVARGPVALALLLAASRLPAAAPCEAFRFAPPRDVAPIPASGTARIADLTGDGRPDFVVLDGRGSFVYGAVQRSDGTFAPLTPMETSAFDLLIADVDGDGVEEGVLVGKDGPRVYRVLDEGRPEIGPVATSLGALVAEWPRAIADLDRDGRSELLVNNGTALLAFRAGSGDAFAGAVVTPLALGAAAGLSLVAGDFDGDGDDDVAVAAENPPTFLPKAPILWGNGAGGFLPGAGVWFPAIQSVALADFDGDGKQDFVYSALRPGIIPNPWLSSLVKYDGAGGLSDETLLVVSSSTVLTAADFDRDGLPDLSLGEPGSAALYRGTGGEFALAASFSGFSPTAAADVDGDGFPDLVGTSETAIRLARNICHTSLPDASVPVVVSLGGMNGVRFETEMTIDSRATRARDLEIRYVPTLGGGAGTATFRLEAGAQLFFPSVLTALANAGVPVPPTGDRSGSLAIRIPGGSPDEIAVTTRVLALGTARGGVSFAERPLGSGLSASAIVGWLRETGGDRSNVAVLNLGGPKEGEVVLRVTLVSAEAGARSVALPEVRLAPGALFQWNRVLASVGMSAGWALVERVSGTAPFFAYGVVNDEGTGDGSFVPAFERDRVPLRSWVVPAVVESGRYSSDLVLTNATASPRAVGFRLVAESLTTQDRTARFRLEVPAFGQLYLPDLVQELRRRGVAGLPARGSEIVGALFADLEGEPSRDLFLGARTSAGKPEGRYGVFYEAIPANEPERWLATVPAVREDAAVRTNVAIVNLGDTSTVFDVTARDPAKGNRVAGDVRTVTVGPRRWVQIGSVLWELRTGLARATVRVEPKSGPARFLAYGVTNEGAVPGAGSDDGTYVPAR